MLTLVGTASFLSVGTARAGVATNDMYSVEMIAYTTTDPANNFFAIATTLAPTFGTTQTFPADADLGQTLTVTSNETTAAGVATDTITISVPNSLFATKALPHPRLRSRTGVAPLLSIYANREQSPA